MKELKKPLMIAAVFLGCFYLPIEILPFRGPVFEALGLLKDYARQHVLLCLVPAFFIAGAVSVFISQASVVKYFGVEAKKIISYGFSSVSGVILAVCSCTVLPLFSGIYKRGAGLGPAIAFLYSGPAINVLAIVLTARILGWQLGLGRAVGAVIFSVVVGLLMHLIFLKEERNRQGSKSFNLEQEKHQRSIGQTIGYFVSMIGILVFANWARPQQLDSGIGSLIYSIKWYITLAFLGSLIFMLIKWFRKDELKDWSLASWRSAEEILPLLFLGVLIAGFLLGRPGHEGIIPSRWVYSLVGSNSLFSNFFAAVVGAFMYFATLTEVPILKGLITAGMGKGPALALLLAGPAVSLPNMLVIRGVLGTKKTIVYVSLVIVMSTFSGIIFGMIYK
ncbi:MAG: permease [Candidatus Omnitrophota bacterium]|nr:permease [Candidatus Omnitrophota bacterium]